PKRSEQWLIFAPDLIVVAAYGRILPTPVLNLPNLGCLNLHPSLLPAYRGPSPVVGALLAGDDTTGVTLMLMDEGMDTGPIIAQRTRVVAPDDDADSLTAALFSDGSDLLLQNLGDWMTGAIIPQPQDDARATYTAKIERAAGAVDWELPAELLARRRRAYAPWPGLYTRWEDKELKLLDVAAAATSDIAPGLVVSADGTEISIGTGAGILTVNKLQLEGRRPATAGEFLRGYPQFVGAELSRDGAGQ
ncbi:Methionyl-tRNA formyltransferase, partial [Geodia barretti]